MSLVVGLTIAKVKHVMSADALGHFSILKTVRKTKTRLIGDTRMFELGACN
jgi:hypothetical protein